MTRGNFAERVHLGPDAATLTIALLGAKGSGKTYGGGKLYEIFHAEGVQCIALDDVGKMYGLRLAANGKGRGLDVTIFGGRHADFPLRPDMGAFLARLLVDTGISCILDTSFFRKGERRRFCTDLAEEFLHLKRNQDDPRPSLLFLDEAHQYMPQRPQKGDERMLGAFEDICLTGRNFGVGLVMGDQRPQHVNKSCLNMVEVLIALRLGAKLDRKAIADWVVEKADTEGKDLSNHLPFLKAGEAFVYAPLLEIYEKTSILPKRTFDSSSTPKVGAKRRQYKLTPIDEKRIAAAMATVVEQVKASDPNELKRQVAELKRQLAAPRATPVTTTKVIKVIKEPAVSDQQVKRLERALDRVWKEGQRFDAAYHEVSEALVKVKSMTSTPLALPPSKTPVEMEAAWASRTAKANSYAPKTPVSKAQTQAEAKDDISPYAQGLLETLRRRQPMRLTRSQLAVLSCRSIGSSAFQTALARLLKSDYVVVSQGGLELTERGADLTAHVEAQPEGDVVAAWEQALPRYELALFRVLRKYPGGILRENLAEYAGKSITSSAFQTAVSTLKKNGLIRPDNEPNHVQLVEELRP